MDERLSHMGNVVRELVAGNPFTPFTISLRCRTKYRVEKPAQVGFRDTLIILKTDAGEAWFPPESIVSLAVEGPWRFPAPDAVVGPKQ